MVLPSPHLPQHTVPYLASTSLSPDVVIAVTRTVTIPGTPGPIHTYPTHTVDIAPHTSSHQAAVGDLGGGASKGHDVPEGAGAGALRQLQLKEGRRGPKAGRGSRSGTGTGARGSSCSYQRMRWCCFLCCNTHIWLLQCLPSILAL